MEQTQIRLTGHIDVPPGRREAVAAALPEHIRLTRAEPGCLQFDVQPDPQVPGRWLVEELFDSREAFEAHQTRARQSRWGEISAGLAREYDVVEVAP